STACRRPDPSRAASASPIARRTESDAIPGLLTNSFAESGAAAPEGKPTRDYRNPGRRSAVTWLSRIHRCGALERRRIATNIPARPCRPARLFGVFSPEDVNPMTRKTILVTGGAGYIGSHVVRQLGEAGERIVVLDDLSTGFRQAVLYGDLVVGNTGDRGVLETLFARYDVDTVMHFAAHTVVPESVADPLKYYRNNTCASRTLLEHAL